MAVAAKAAEAISIEAAGCNASGQRSFSAGIPLQDMKPQMPIRGRVLAFRGGSQSLKSAGGGFAEFCSTEIALIHPELGCYVSTRFPIKMHWHPTRGKIRA